MDLLYDLLLNGILFIPNQLTTMEQPVKMISQLIGDGRPLVEAQPVSFTRTFLQTPH